MSEAEPATGGTSAGRRSSERSPNYPRINLEDAIKRARLIYENEGRASAHRDVVVGHWGYTPKSGTGMVVLGAVRAFGLLEGSGSSLRLSELALDIVTDDRLLSKERAAAIKSAALLPKVHKQIWDHFDGKLPSDDNLKYHLVRQLGFTESGASDFISQFRATLAFADNQSSGILSPQGGEDGAENERCPSVGEWVQWTSQGVEQFSTPKKVTEVDEKAGFVLVEGSQTGLPISEVRSVEPPRETERSDPPNRRLPGMNQNTLDLDEGAVTLQYPKELSPESYEDLKVWLDLMARRVKRAVRMGGSDEKDGADGVE